MKEQEYIDVSDLARIRDIRSIVSNIMPEGSSCIDKKEYLDLCKIMHNWEIKLDRKLKIND